MGRISKTDLLPPFVHRRVPMYVYFGLALICIAGITAESFRDSKTSAATTQTIIEDISKFSPYVTLVPSGITMKESSNVYDVLFPEETNPFIPGEYHFVTFKLDYPSTDKTEISYSKKLTFKGDEHEGKAYRIGYYADGYEFALRALSPCPSCHLDIQNEEGVKIGEYDFSIGYKEATPNHRLTLEKGLERESFRPNSVVYARDTIIEAYAASFDASPVYSRNKKMTEAYGYPVYDDYLGRHLTEESVRKHFPSFNPEIEAPVPLTYVKDDSLIKIPEEALGDYLIQSGDETVSLHVEGAPLPAPTDPITLDPYGYFTSRIEAEEGTISTNDETILIKDDTLNEAEFEKALRVRILDGEATIDPQYVYNAETKQSVRVDNAVRLTRADVKKELSIVVESVLYPDLIHSETIRVAPLEIPKHIVRAEVLLDGKVFSPNGFIPERGKSYDFSARLIYSDGEIVETPSLIVSGVSSNVSVTYPSPGHALISVNADGPTTFTFSVWELTLSVNVTIGSENIFNNSHQMMVLARKILGHAFIYVFCGMSVGAFFFYYLSGYAYSRMWPLYTLALALPLCLITETVQLFVPTRSADWLDVAYNALGFVLGIAIDLVIAVVLRAIWKHKAEKLDGTEEEKRLLRETGLMPKKK